MNSNKTGKEQGMLEVTVKQLQTVVDSQPEELWAIDGCPFDKVVMVGQLLGMDSKSSKTLFSFSDSTGAPLSLQVFAKGDELDRLMHQINYKPFMYARVIVVVKQF